MLIVCLNNVEINVYKNKGEINMKSLFLSKNKDLWGFTVPKAKSRSEIMENNDLIISKVKSHIVKKIVDFAYEDNLEIHVLPNISKPCVIIKTPHNVWYYLCSQSDAETYMKQVNASGGISYCI